MYHDDGMQDSRAPTTERCWAKALGDCEGKISREHLVSGCFFPEGGVTVRGFSWCLDEKTVGLGSLTGRILCRRHNSKLSDLDSAIMSTLANLEKSVRLFEARRKLLSRRWTVAQFAVDGLLLERWFLKTFINMSVVDNNRIIGEGTRSVGTPSDELVKIAFGQSKFSGNLGLYSAAFAGETFNFKHGLRLTPKSVGPNLLAGMFTLYGFRFFLNLQSQEVKEHQGSQLIHHPKEFWFVTNDARRRQVRSHRLCFRW